MSDSVTQKMIQKYLEKLRSKMSDSFETDDLLEDLETHIIEAYQNKIFDFGHDFTDGCLASDDFPRTGHTSIHAFTTQVAYVYIGHRLVISGRNCLMSACLYALAAHNTSA